MTPRFVFHAGKLPSDYRYAFEEALFNSAAFRELQARDWTSCYILHPDTLTIHGHVHFHVQDGVAQTPLRAPFGSAEFSRELPAATLYDFLEFAELQLAGAGVTEIIVKDPPDAYAPERAALVHAFFHTRGYTAIAADLGSVIPVSGRRFADLVNARKRWRLRQSRSHASRFAQLGNDAQRAVYDFIAACRRSKQYRLSMTADELRQAIDRFPERYRLFGVYAGDALVAASVTVHISEGILYHFISDHVRNTGSFSPGLLLMEGIYQYCQTKGVGLLDLGTSVVDAKPKFKLFNYKRELGAKPTIKFTFRKKTGGL